MAKRKSSSAAKAVPAKGATASPRKGDVKLPVTLLSGFLGSGKTTLLRHILNSNHGMKICVIVNDMASVNVDGAAVGKLVHREAKLVQMQNGCICCTLRQDLLEEVARLAKEGSFDYLIIESTGIGEPMQVAETFAFELPSNNVSATLPAPHGNDAAAEPPTKRQKRAKKQGKGKGKEGDAEADAEEAEGACPLPITLSSLARLDTCVTVVDASSFWDNLASLEELADRHPGEVEEGDDRNISALLVDQVEFADVILLNKCDLVSKKQKAAIKSLITRLNPRAKVHETVRSVVGLGKVVGTNMFDLEQAAKAPGWLQALNNSGHESGVGAPTTKSESEEYGVTSFVYTARKPFHPGRLFHDFLEKYFLTRVTDVAAASDDDDDEDEEEGSGSGSGSDEGTESGSGDDSEGESESESEDGTEDNNASAEGAEQDSVVDYEAAKKRVSKATKRDLGGLMRSKGYFWLASQRGDALGWSHAGVLLHLTREGAWLADVPKEMWPSDVDTVARVEALMQPEIGDRRQELVFIGQDLKEEGIRAALDACLATDEEVAQGIAGTLEDPMFGGDA